jgi:hypothetical protein
MSLERFGAELIVEIPPLSQVPLWSRSMTLLWSIELLSLSNDVSYVIVRISDDSLPPTIFSRIRRQSLLSAINAPSDGGASSLIEMTHMNKYAKATRYFIKHAFVAQSAERTTLRVVRSKRQS